MQLPWQGANYYIASGSKVGDFFSVFRRLNSPLFSFSSIQQPATNAASLGPENS